MANGSVRPSTYTCSLSITDIRETAGVSSSASSSSSSSAPWHGSLAPRARTRRTSSSFFSPERDHNTLLMTRLRSRSPAQNSPTNTTRSQCLALDSHPLCLELLAHVGYVYYYHTTSEYTRQGTYRSLTDGVLFCSYHFPRPVAPSHSAHARRPPTRVQSRACRVEGHVLRVAAAAS